MWQAVATPLRVRVGRCGVSGAPVALVAAFGLLDLREQQPEAALVEAGDAGGLGVAARFAGQAGFQRGTGQQQAAFGVLGVGLGQLLSRLQTRQRVGDRGQGEFGQVGMRGEGPAMADR